MAHPADLTAAATPAPSLLDLDSPILVLIAAHLTLRELLQFETVCRRCVQVAREPALWRRLLRLEFDLACAEPGGADGGRWRAAFRAAHAAAAAPASLLALDGAYTDGGCDGDGRYTVDALFSPALWEPYCSALGRNVHCLGLLRAGVPGDSAAEVTAAVRREYILSRCSAASVALFEPVTRRLPGRASHSQRGFVVETDLQRWPDAQLESLFVQLWELAQAAHPLGSLLFAQLAGVEREREVARCAALAQQLRAERDAAAAAAETARRSRGGSDSDAASGDEAEEAQREAQPAAAVAPAAKVRIYSPRVLAAPPADVPRLQASASRLRVSRVGQFSCPLHCGAVLLGEAPRGGDGTPRSRRAALAACVDESRMLRALDDATDLQAVRDASAAGFLPRIVHIGTSSAGVWAEFEPRGLAATPTAPPGVLWPVVWFAFTPRAEATARALQEEAAYERAWYDALASGHIVAVPRDNPGGWQPVDGSELPMLHHEDHYDLLDMPLTARHGVAGLVCIKLIAGENLMEDWGDDHAEPNIDATALEVHGFIAPQLPPDGSGKREGLV